MIDHKNHYARYCELISLAASYAPARQRDGEMCIRDSLSGPHRTKRPDPM